MLIRGEDLEAIRDGRIDLAFRRWKRPTVKAGGTLTTAVGVLAIESVDHIEPSEIDERQARRAGFPSRAALLERLEGRAGDLYRIRLRWAGRDPREELRERARLSKDEVTEIRRRLRRYDAASRVGPWTAKTLALIRDHPGVRAADLAAKGAWQTPWFKRNVRKLKALGLTESLEVGYRLSPRGRAYIAS